MSEMEALLDTREGLALANAAYNEGMTDALRAVNQAERTGVFTKPRSPYFAEWARVRREQEEA